VLNAADITARLARSLFVARTQAGWSQAQLGAKLPHGDANEIRRWEHGRHRISERKLLTLVELFPYDLAWWYTDHNDDVGQQ
jgi:ribosome-binding protein aMBF1 (putative translation factor)